MQKSHTWNVSTPWIVSFPSSLSLSLSLFILQGSPRELYPCSAMAKQHGMFVLLELGALEWVMTCKAGTSSQLDSYVELEGPQFSIQSLVCCCGIFISRVTVEENLAKEKPKLACLVPYRLWAREYMYLLSPWPVCGDPGPWVSYVIGCPVLCEFRGLQQFSPAWLMVTTSAITSSLEALRHKTGLRKAQWWAAEGVTEWGQRGVPKRAHWKLEAHPTLLAAMEATADTEP